MARRSLLGSAGLTAAGALFLLSIHGPGPVSAQSAKTEKVVGGPYVVNLDTRSATVMWLVQTGEMSFGVDPAGPDKTQPVLRAEHVVLSGVRGASTYHYQAFPGEAGKGSFKTPPVGEAQFEFVVYGDTRTRDDVHRSVVAAVLKYANPDFVVHTGDLVANGPDSSLWPVFFDIERDLLRKAAFYPSLGNHERNADNYYDFLNGRPYYSFDWGTAHFSVINSDVGNAGPTEAAKDAFWKEQTTRLENDLASAQKADFRFVIAHHPPITAVRRRQGDNPQMIALEPMFEKYKVTAGFFGHDHNYQHYRKNGIHYFTCGGGGAPLYDVDLPPADITVKVESTENFMVVKVDGKKAHFEVRKPSGDVIDSADLAQ